MGLTQLGCQISEAQNRKGTEMWKSWCRDVDVDVGADVDDDTEIKAK